MIQTEYLQNIPMNRLVDSQHYQVSAHLLPGPIETQPGFALGHPNHPSEAVHFVASNGQMPQVQFQSAESTFSGRAHPQEQQAASEQQTPSCCSQSTPNQAHFGSSSLSGLSSFHENQHSQGYGHSRTDFENIDYEALTRNASSSSSAHMDLKTIGQQQVFSKVPQTTMYHIPSGVATSDNPMTTEAQAELLRSGVYSSQKVPMHAVSGITGIAAIPAEANCNGGTCGSVSHYCHCGDNCRCTGCPIHPDNPGMHAKLQEIAPHLDFVDWGSSETSRPQSSYGDMMHSLDDTSLAHMDATLVAHVNSGWQNFNERGDSRSNDIDPNLVQLSGYTTPTEARRMIPESSSQEYVHYVYSVFPPSIECNAPQGADCRCAQGCACPGCLIHSGHFDQDLVGDGSQPGEI